MLSSLLGVLAAWGAGISGVPQMGDVRCVRGRAQPWIVGRNPANSKPSEQECHLRDFRQ